MFIRVHPWFNRLIHDSSFSVLFFPRSFAFLAGNSSFNSVRLLLTNDDSIASVFLHELAHALRAAGHELYIVAPKTEQSWIGAAKSRHRAVASERDDAARGLNCPTWIVDGTPSDCVNIALAHLLPGAGFPAPDAVLSGINIGLNASLAFILASGTIAGAWEGATHGLPAIAFSQDLSAPAFDRLKREHGQPDPSLLLTVRTSAQHAARLVPKLVAATAPRSFTVHNVNFPFPCHAHSEMRRTVPARVVVPALFSPAADDGTHRFVFNLGEDLSPAEPLSDRAALAAGHISHSILDFQKLGQ